MATRAMTSIQSARGTFTARLSDNRGTSRSSSARPSDSSGLHSSGASPAWRIPPNPAGTTIRGAPRPSASSRVSIDPRAMGASRPRALRGRVAKPVTTRFEATITGRTGPSRDPTCESIRGVGGLPISASPGLRDPDWPSQRSNAQTSPRIGGMRMAVNLQDIARPPKAALARKSRRPSALNKIGPEPVKHRGGASEQRQFHGGQ